MHLQKVVDMFTVTKKIIEENSKANSILNGNEKMKLT